MGEWRLLSIKDLSLAELEITRFWHTFSPFTDLIWFTVPVSFAVWKGKEIQLTRFTLLIYLVLIHIVDHGKSDLAFGNQCLFGTLERKDLFKNAHAKFECKNSNIQLKRKWDRKKMVKIETSRVYMANVKHMDSM